MSHYYHVYPGREEEGVGRGTRFRWVRKELSPGHVASSQRYESSAMASSTPPRSSTPTADFSSDPPPPGVSPVRSRTPEGVFTQVQQKKAGTKDDDELSEDLFNDSFDVNDIPEEMLDSRSNLTQIFPHCNMEEEDDESAKRKDGLDETKKDEPDLLSKVLARATTLEEDERISQLDQGGGSDIPVENLEMKTGASFGSQSQRQQQQQKQQQKSTSMDEDVSEQLKGDNECSSGWGQFESSASSARLTTSQVQQLLQGLTPDPTITRSFSEGHQLPQSSAIQFTMQPVQEGCGYSQVSLDGSWEPPKKIVPTATSSRPTTSTSYQVSDNAREIALAVRHARHAVVDIVDGAVVETGLERHDFPAVSRSMVPANRLQDQPATGLDEEVEITIPEVIDTAKNQVNVTFETGPVAKFILMARDSLTSRWSVPSRLRFHDVMNQVESRIRRLKLTCGSVLDWCSEWRGGGGVGLLGLRVLNPRELHAFRTVVTEINIGGLWYNTYPKDFLAHKTEISIHLRKELRCLDLAYLPHSLFEKNSLLEGGIRVRYSRHRDERGDDPSILPLLQDGGKVVILEADDEFAASLQKYPHNYSFRLGSFTAKMRCESDVVDFNERVPESAPSRTNSFSSSSTSSTLWGGLSSQEVRNIDRRARWNRLALTSDSFQLPYPVPSVYQEKRTTSGQVQKVSHRGRGKFRDRRGRGSSIKKSWK